MPDPNPKIEALRKQGSALRQRMFELEEKLVAALRAEVTETAAAHERRAAWEQLVKAVGPWSKLPPVKRAELTDWLRRQPTESPLVVLGADALEAVPGLLRELQLDRYAAERNGARVIELEKQLRPPPSPDHDRDEAEERSLNEARAFCRMTEELRERIAHHLEKKGEDFLRVGWKDWTTAAEVLRAIPDLLKLAEQAQHFRSLHAQAHNRHETAVRRKDLPPDQLLGRELLIRLWSAADAWEKARVLLGTSFAEAISLKNVVCEILKTGVIEELQADPASDVVPVDPGPSFAEPAPTPGGHRCEVVGCRRDAVALTPIGGESPVLLCRIHQNSSEDINQKLNGMAQMIAATTGCVLKLPDALDYATGALKDLGTLAASYREPDELPDSTTMVHRAVGLHERWRKEHDELLLRRQQARAYSDELDRLAAAYRTPQDDELDCATTVDRAIAAKDQPPTSPIADLELAAARKYLPAITEALGEQSWDEGVEALSELMSRLCRAHGDDGPTPRWAACLEAAIDGQASLAEHEQLMRRLWSAVAAPGEKHWRRAGSEGTGAEATTERAIKMLSEAEKLRDRYSDQLTRLCKAYRRPDEQPLAADVGVDRAIALQQRHQRKALEQPQTPAATIVADFFEKVTAEQVADLAEHLEDDERGTELECPTVFDTGRAAATMLRGLLRLAYPEVPAS